MPEAPDRDRDEHGRAAFDEDLFAVDIIDRTPGDRRA
jgi:hypothetical protein